MKANRAIETERTMHIAVRMAESVYRTSIIIRGRGVVGRARTDMVAEW